ncbi:hypothetical protein PPSIR1_31443, partial [Plesiocystis pacifica SIR-1]
MVEDESLRTTLLDTTEAVIDDSFGDDDELGQRVHVLDDFRPRRPTQHPLTSRAAPQSKTNPAPQKDRPPLESEPRASAPRRAQKGQGGRIPQRKEPPKR